MIQPKKKKILDGRVYVRINSEDKAKAIKLFGDLSNYFRTQLDRDLKEHDKQIPSTDKSVAN